MLADVPDASRSPARFTAEGGGGVCASQPHAYRDSEIRSETSVIRSCECPESRWSGRTGNMSYRHTKFSTWTPLASGHCQARLPPSNFTRIQSRVDLGRTQVSFGSVYPALGSYVRSELLDGFDVTGPAMGVSLLILINAHPYQNFTPPVMSFSALTRSATPWDRQASRRRQFEMTCASGRHSCGDVSGRFYNRAVAGTYTAGVTMHGRGAR